MTAEPGARVLFVDDEPNILSAYRRQFRRVFSVEVAQGPEEGLKAIGSLGPFAVVVSDMRMPQMTGVQFLTHVRRLAPDTVRVMLTGYADQQTAIDAVNEGNIFRFLTKPCPQETIERALTSAIRQYRLVTGERELLEKTLGGSISVLTEVLSLVHPAAFSRASRIGRTVRRLAEALALDDLWEYDVAAALSQVGCVVLSPDEIAALDANGQAGAQEERLRARRDEVGARLIEKIPRLESVARMVARQSVSFRRCAGEAAPESERAAFGAQLLKIASDYDRHLSRGLTECDALSALRREAGDYNPALISALDALDLQAAGARVCSFRLADLQVDMIVHEDILATNGLLLVARGQTITPTVIQRLHSFHEGMGVVEPVVVELPPDGATAMPGDAVVAPAI